MQDEDGMAVDRRPHRFERLGIDGPARIETRHLGAERGVQRMDRDCHARASRSLPEDRSGLAALSMRGRSGRSA
jgi:hypothetical protein